MSALGSAVQKLGLWIGLAGEAGLPLAFLCAWIMPEQQSDDGSLALLLVYAGELYVLVLGFGFSGPDWRKWPAALLMMALGVFIVSESIQAGYWLVAFAILSMMSRLFGMLVGRREVFPDGPTEVGYAVGTLVVSTLVLGGAWESGLLPTPSRTNAGVAELGVMGTIYFGAVFLIRVCKLTRNRTQLQQAPANARR